MPSLDTKLEFVIVNFIRMDQMKDVIGGCMSEAPTVRMVVNEVFVHREILQSGTVQHWCGSNCKVNMLPYEW